MVGSETTQNGLMSFFELFQIKTLNQRLVLVLFELCLKGIFPHNYMDEIFGHLYASFDSKSTRSTTWSSADWPPHLSKFIARIWQKWFVTLSLQSLVRLYFSTFNLLTCKYIETTLLFSFTLCQGNSTVYDCLVDKLNATLALLTTGTVLQFE